MAGAAGIQNPVVVFADITGDATGGDDYTLTRSASVFDVVVIPTAASGGGTVLVGRGADAITDAIPAAVLDTVGRPTTIDTTFQDLDVGDTLRFTTNGAADRAQVFVSLLPPPAAVAALT